ncbi:SUMF1/EgtB/PvdO family nonheme iron enzyme [Seonamhaeicola sp.]|uniref:formylglycine-generating enzyme family protein n=1 Tax=Seonamhaeicola sp. TaxID=1912245 RepID=UPI002620D993|nr:SUMF1/EgtB/PvdO family nonheme iron enzyme [Seonamhaeicola sp.]
MVNLRFTIFFFLIATLSINAQSFKNYTQELKTPELSFEMIAVKGGSFSMGTNDPKRKADEKPSHEVAIDDFWIGKQEITWEQYDAFVFGEFGPEQFIEESKLKSLGIDAVSGATPPYVDMSFNMGKGKSPAVNMTQYAAIMYCKWLTSKTGIFYRLPTEAEWEYACKKGQTDQTNNLEAIAWYHKNSQEKYQKTGQKQSNTLGIHDLLGNVSEWVYDQYSPTFYKNSPKKNPINMPTELYPRVLRGGSWKDTADKLCCTSRQGSKQDWKQRDPQIPKSNWWHTDAAFVGFRIVRPKVQPSEEDIKKYWLDAIEDFGI